MTRTSSVPARLAAFAVVLLAALGVGAAVGAAVGPIDVADEPAHDMPAEQPGGH